MSAPSRSVGAIGARVERKEDGKLLQGQAQWVDNMHVPGMVFLGIVRSPYAHARITKVNVSPALAHADVVAAWSGDDLADEWQGSLPCAWIPTEDTNAPGHKPVAIDKARYVGDAVAVIAATSRGAAEDAAELVEVEYEPLPAVVDVEAALADGAPIVHEEFGTNRCYTWTLDAGEVDRLFAEAAVTVSERYVQNRLIPNAIEPRAVFVTPVPATGEFTLWSTTQVPHIARITLSGVVGHPGGEAARDRARRRRRLRLEAERLRRGGARPRDRAAARPRRSSGRRRAARATSRRSTAATRSRRSSSRRRPRGRSPPSA